VTGSNVIYGMGMLEMGMTMSYEDLLIDQEIVRMIRRVLQGIAVNKDTIALDVIKKVGPNGNYLGQAFFDGTGSNFTRLVYMSRKYSDRPIWVGAVYRQ